jgi:hypothetical protein
MTTGEEIIEEVRSSRRRMSLECGHDPARLIAYLKQYNDRYAAEIKAYLAARETPDTETRQHVSLG